MKIKEVIDFIEKDKLWVNWNQTRDRVLIGDVHQSVEGIAVCWVATNKVIDECIEKGINFIITHENPFYLCSTQLPTNLYSAIEEKKNKLTINKITVYRCHDVWDSFPMLGISDVWAKQMGDCINDTKIDKFTHYLRIKSKSVIELATNLSHKMKDDGENGVYIIGNVDRQIETVMVGTGAYSNVYEMQLLNPDVYIVSEDGINCWSAAQYVCDLDKAMIIVSHCCCEKAGLKEMIDYLQNEFNGVNIEYINDGMNATFVAV